MVVVVVVVAVCLFACLLGRSFVGSFVCLFICLFVRFVWFRFVLFCSAKIHAQYPHHCALHGTA